MARASVELIVEASKAVNPLRKVQEQSKKVEDSFKRNQKATRNLQAALLRLQRNSAQSLKSVRADLDRIAQSAQKAAGKLKGVGGALAGLGAGAALTGSLRGAADLAQTQIRLEALSQEYGEFNRIQQLVSQNATQFNLSQRESAQQFADVYARLRPLGISLEEIQSTFKGFTATAISSGASAQAASGAFLQLSQALGSGRLQGDEFRSIAEQVPGVLRLVAAEMNVTVGELKKLGSDGKITSDILINALAKGFDENKDKIEKIIELSPAQKFKELSNATSDLSDAVGTDLLPAVTPLVEGLTGLVHIVGRLPAPIKTLGSALFGLAAGATAAAAAMNALGISVSATAIKGLAVLGAKIALVAAPLTGMALAFQDAQDRKEAFDAALKSDSLDVVEAALKQAQNETTQLERALEVIKSTPYFKGQAGDIQRLQGEIDLAREKVEALTQRRSLFIDVVFGIPDFHGEKRVGGAEFQQQLQQELESLGLKYGGPGTQVSDIKPAARSGSRGAVAQERVDMSQKLLDLNRSLRSEQEAGNERAIATLELMIRRHEIMEDDLLAIEKQNALEQANHDFRQKILTLDQRITDERVSQQEQAQQAFADFMKAEEEAAQRRLEADPGYQMRQRLEEMLSLQNQVAAGATAIGNAFSSAFRDVITGTKSADEALADMMSAVAEHFLNMATQIIAQQLAMILYGTIMQALGFPLPGAGAGAGGGGGFAGVPMKILDSVLPTKNAAEGGFVDRPTNALIGEGGEPEYVIPESKMRESMARYSRGSRGASVIAGGDGDETSGDSSTPAQAPIDVRYTVERINSVDYVTADQFQRGMQNAASQGAKQGEQNTLRRLQMSGSTRRRIGM